MKLTLEHKDTIRLDFHGGNNFTEVKAVSDYEHNSLEFRYFNMFSYWALVRVKGSYDGIRLVCFPNKEWFDEWVAMAKPEILFEKESEETKSKEREGV